MSRRPDIIAAAIRPRGVYSQCRAVWIISLIYYIADLGLQRSEA